MPHRSSRKTARLSRLPARILCSADRRSLHARSGRNCVTECERLRPRDHGRRERRRVRVLTGSLATLERARGELRTVDVVQTRKSSRAIRGRTPATIGRPVQLASASCPPMRMPRSAQPASIVMNRPNAHAYTGVSPVQGGRGGVVGETGPQCSSQTHSKRARTCRRLPEDPLHSSNMPRAQACSRMHGSASSSLWPRRRVYAGQRRPPHLETAACDIAHARMCARRVGWPGCCTSKVRGVDRSGAP
jgi:hypothetical protein